ERRAIGVASTRLGGLAGVDAGAGFAAARAAEARDDARDVELRAAVASGRGAGRVLEGARERGAADGNTHERIVEGRDASEGLRVDHAGRQIVPERGRAQHGELRRGELARGFGREIAERGVAAGEAVALDRQWSETERSLTARGGEALRSVRLEQQAQR